MKTINHNSNDFQVGSMSPKELVLSFPHQFQHRLEQNHPQHHPCCHVFLMQWCQPFFTMIQESSLNKDSFPFLLPLPKSSFLSLEDYNSLVFSYFSSSHLPPNCQLHSSGLYPISLSRSETSVFPSFQKPQVVTYIPLVEVEIEVAIEYIECGIGIVLYRTKKLMFVISTTFSTKSN